MPEEEVVEPLGGDVAVDVEVRPHHFEGAVKVEQAQARVELGRCASMANLHGATHPAICADRPGARVDQVGIDLDLADSAISNP